MPDLNCRLLPQAAGVNATATVLAPIGARRPRKDPTRISAQEYLILLRMKRIDRGQGCHAAIERIGGSYDDRHQSFSPAQTRRHIRRLRELGEICFAGQTADGRNVYLFPERTYVREEVPIDLGRPVDHLQSLPSGASWSTEKAAQILRLTERGEVASRTTVIDEYPVNRQILKNYGEATIRRAIGRIKPQYPALKNIQNPSALLRYFISLEVQDQKKRQAAAAAEPKAKPPAGPCLPADTEKEILALLRTGRAAEAHRLAVGMANDTPADVQALTRAAPASRPTETTVNLAALVEHYLKAKMPSDLSMTRSFHRQKSASLIRLLGDFNLRELTPAALTIYQGKRRSDRVSERTIRDELKVLHKALEYGLRSGLVASELVASLDMPPGRAGPRRNVRRVEEVASCL